MTDTLRIINPARKIFRCDFFANVRTALLALQSVAAFKEKEREKTCSWLLEECKFQGL